MCAAEYPVGTASVGNNVGGVNVGYSVLSELEIEGVASVGNCVGAETVGYAVDVGLAVGVAVVGFGLGMELG